MSSSASQYNIHIPPHHLSKHRLKSSLNSIQTSKSLRSLTSTQAATTPHWWQRRPILKDAHFTNLQMGSYYAGIFCLCQGLIQFLFALFNVYCLLNASPGSSHFRQLGISFIFVYTGNQIVRWFLVFSSVVMLLLSIYLMISSGILLKALLKEQENRFKPFLRAILIYMICRFCALIFEALVNDPIFFYHQLNLVVWTLALICDVFALLIVFSNYQELSDLTRLEDFAKEKAQSLSISRSMQDTFSSNRRSSGSSNSISGTPSQSPQQPQSSSSPGTQPQTQPRTESSLSSVNRTSLAESTSLSTASSVNAARKQHLEQLYIQQQQLYAQIRRQQRERDFQRQSSADQTDNSGPYSPESSRGYGQPLSVTNLPPIQRQATPLL